MFACGDSGVWVEKNLFSIKPTVGVARSHFSSHCNAVDLLVVVVAKSS